MIKEHGFQNYILLKIRNLFFVSIFLVLPSLIFSQRLTGKVVDQKGEPIIGASVMVRGTTIGTTTDVNGLYSLSIPTELKRPNIVYSFIGFSGKVIQYEKQSVLNVTLEENIKELEELVIIGYGTVKKSDVTGSLSSVKVGESDVAEGKGIDKILQGKVAGVFVNASSGAPGAAVDVRIRGTNSLGSNNEPLYIVDGVMMDANEDVKSPFATGGQERQNGLTGINPADIASMEVLKDASATAIYGSRGANGVVLITTKQGSSEKARIEISSNVSLSEISHYIPMMDGETYKKYRTEIGKAIPDSLLKGTAPVNWQKEATRMAVSQNYRVSIGGQNKNKNNYYFAAGFSNVQGVVKETGMKSGDIRLNLDQNANNWLRINSRTTATIRNSDWMEGTEPQGGINTSMIRSMIQFQPLQNFLDNQGNATLDESEIVSSPTAWIKGYQDKSTEFRILSNLDLDFKINKEITFRTTAKGDFRNKVRNRFYNTMVYTGNQKNGLAGFSELVSSFYGLEALLLYNFKIKTEHKINGTIGTTWDDKFIQYRTTSAENFPNKALGFYGMAGALKVYPLELDYQRMQVLSGLARLNYTYADKYMVTLTGRVDGASRFASGKKWGFFPSLALAWRVNQESFMSDNKKIDNLKVRLGIGQVGKQSINPYQTIQNYSLGYSATSDNGYIVSYTPSNIANTNLTWETTSQANAGIDLGLYSGRLNVTLDAYYKSTDNLLQNIALPASTGFTSFAVNRGTIENKGVELTIEGTLIRTKKVIWTLGVNGSLNRNRIKEVGLPTQYFSYEVANAKGYLGGNISGNVIQTPANIFLQGRPIGVFYGLQADGIAQSDKLTSDGRPVMWNGLPIIAGMLNYRDVNDDGIIDLHDRVILGNPNPDLNYGFNTSFKWKGLSIDVLMNGVLGRDIVNANLYMENFQVGGDSKNRRYDAFRYAWRTGDPYGTNLTTKYPSLTAPQPTQIGSWVVEDGSYLRLSNVTLAYELPIAKYLKMQRISVSISGNNLYVLTKYDGFDPEVNSFSNNERIVGVDWNSYPAMRTILFGLNLTF